MHVPYAETWLDLTQREATFTPMDRDGRQGFRFEATGTVEKLIAGAVPGFPQAVVSPTGTVRWKTPIDVWFPADETSRAA